MTSQEFKFLVYKNQRSERFFGYAMFLIPFGASLALFGSIGIKYFSEPESASGIRFALVVMTLCAAFAWWGFRKIGRKFKTFISIRFDASKLTAQEIVDVVVKKLTYRKINNRSGLPMLKSTGWQTSHIIYLGVSEGELLIDLRLDDNYGFFNWTTRKLKKRFVNEIISLGKEKQCEVSVEMDAV